MNFKEAYSLAAPIARKLHPHCERGKIKIAGSLRRKKQDGIHDIEIVCIPKASVDLLGEPLHRDNNFISIAMGLGSLEKGNLWKGKHIQLTLPEKVLFEIYVASVRNFGWIYLLRTGSGDFNQKMLGLLRNEGVVSNDGHLWRDEKVIEVASEKQVFDLAKIDYIKPESRDEYSL